MLVFKRRPEQAIRIGDDVCVRILSTDRRETKIGIDAPPNVRVDREEVHIQRLRARVEPASRFDEPAEYLPPGVGLAMSDPFPCGHSVTAAVFRDPDSGTIRVSIGSNCPQMLAVCDALARTVRPDGTLALSPGDMDLTDKDLHCAGSRCAGAGRIARLAVVRAIRMALDSGDPRGSSRRPHSCGTSAACGCSHPNCKPIKIVPA